MLDYEIIRILSYLKFCADENSSKIPFFIDGVRVGALTPVRIDTLKSVVEMITQWRKENKYAFFSWIDVTPESTERWLMENILFRKDRILFLLNTLDGVAFGHVGLANFDFNSRSCELDNVLRGRSDVLKGGMSAAVQSLLKWTFETLRVNRVFLRVFEDNERAVLFYQSNGFKIIKKLPLKMIQKEGNVYWIESNLDDFYDSNIQKYSLHMQITNHDFFNS